MIQPQKVRIIAVSDLPTSQGQQRPRKTGRSTRSRLEQQRIEGVNDRHRKELKEVDDQIVYEMKKLEEEKLYMAKKKEEQREEEEWLAAEKAEFVKSVQDKTKLLDNKQTEFLGKV